MIDFDRINSAPSKAVAARVFGLIDHIQVQDHSHAMLAAATLLMLLPSDARHRLLAAGKNLADHPSTHVRGHFAAVRMFIEEDLGLDLD